MMHVLFLSTWYPLPPDNGSKIRAYSLLKALRQRHEVTLQAFHAERDGTPAASDLDCASVRAVHVYLERNFHRPQWARPATSTSLALWSSRPRIGCGG